MDGYYNGSSRREDDKIPEIPPASAVYVLDIYEKSKYGTGNSRICHTRLMSGDSAQDAIARYRRYLDLVVDDVDAHLAEQDRETIEFFEIDVHTERRIENALLEVQNQIYDDERTPQLDAQERSLREQLRKVQEGKVRRESRRDRILSRIVWEQTQIDAGCVEAEPIPLTHPVPVSYYSDWRSFTNYAPT